MAEALICEGTRTPIGKFGGSLSSIRTDDLASLPLVSLCLGRAFDRSSLSCMPIASAPHTEF